MGREQAREKEREKARGKAREEEREKAREEVKMKREKKKKAGRARGRRDSASQPRLFLLLSWQAAAEGPRPAVVTYLLRRLGVDNF